MAYKPEIDKNVVYVDGNGTKYKVDSLTNDGVNVIKLKSDGTVDKTIYWPESKWNNKKLSVEGNPPPPPPEDNSFTFQYDESGNLTILKDGKPVKRLNIRGPEGKPGKDGMPGQDGAPGQKGQDGAAGQPGKDGAPGEKGQDGAPGKDGAPGPEGKQGTPGPKGEDGVYWYPEISEDGTQLRFKNRNNSSEHTEWYGIKGPKGDTGGEGPRGIVGPAGPVFIPSVNSDGELSWSNTGQGLTNPTTRNIKGDKGDKGDKGATFHPIVKDGVLYWYDDNGNLVKGITPVRITGAQGKQGEQGAQGLSAYQIWLKQGYRGTEQDFLDSLKGEKGSPAPPASFSFKDVKDFTCEVQEIDTNLIVDSEESTDSPEEIIEDRINEIKKLRVDGHEKVNQTKYRVGWFKKLTWWCAGADRDLLTMCPSDHSKYVGIGTVILFTALMAFFSSFIAIRLVFDPIHFALGKGYDVPVPAFLFACFWGAMIFFLDRFITNTMYSDGKVTISKEEFICGLPRITIAIFLGIVISAPLELKIFEKKIQMEMDSQKRAERAQAEHKARKIATQNFALSLDDLSKTREIYEKQLSDAHRSTDALMANRPKDEIKDRSGSYLGKDGQYHPYQKSENLNAGKQKEWDEKNGNTLQSFSNSAANATDSIASINKRIRKVEDRRDASIQKDVDDILKQFENDFDTGLSRQLSTLHSIAMDGYKPWYGKNSETNANDDEVKPQEDSLIDTILLHRLWYYLFFSPQGLIMLLFILIDISPVLYKMMLADGKYDNYLHQEKLLAQDKIRLSLSNMLKKLNDSELKRVAPFIMGDVYEKMAGDSYIYKTEDKFIEEIAKQKKMHPFWRVWPFSMLRWIFWKEDEKPSAPVIILNERKLSDSQKRNLSNLDTANKEVFDEVLEMKKKIILASYRRWYKTQHDCIICDDVNDENKARDPFDDEAPEGDDSEIHMGDNNDSDTWNHDSEEDFMVENLDEEKSKADNDDSEESNTDDSRPKSEENVSEDYDNDEQELPDDDGDDNPKK